MAGDPDRVAEKIQILEAMGFDHLLCNFAYRSLAETRAEMRLFAAEVIPRFRRTRAGR